MHKRFWWRFLGAAALILGSVLSCPAAQSPFPGLSRYLQQAYGNPFELVGEVKEVAGDRLLFASSAAGVASGRRLLVCEHRQGVSARLQNRISWIRVQAVFPQSAVAQVEQQTGRQVQPGDWVLTPAAPLIHVYTNISQKHAFQPYQDLIGAMISKRIQIQEIEGDAFEKRPAPGELLLRVEAEADQLVCRLTGAPGGPLRHMETVANPLPAQLAYAPGHPLQIARPLRKTAAAAAADAAAGLKGPFSQSLDRQAASTPAEGSGLYRLSGSYTRVVACDLDGDRRTELALLSQDGVAVFDFRGSKLEEKHRYEFKTTGLLPLHLHAMDLDADGGDELLVTLAEKVVLLDKQDNRLVSQILTLEEKGLRPIVDAWPFYLRVIQDPAGEAVGLAQKEGAYGQYDGPIFRIGWDGAAQKPRIGQAYAPARGVYAIYQFNIVPSDPLRLLILEPNNELHGYFAPEQRLEVTGQRNYGRFEEVAYPLKLENDKYLGGFDKVTFKDFYAPRRFELGTEFGQRCFLVYKQRSGDSTGMVVGGVNKMLRTSLGEDQLVGLSWDRDRIRETWQSRKLAKDVLDFTFLKDKAQVLVLYRDADGLSLEALE